LLLCGRYFLRFNLPRLQLFRPFQFFSTCCAATFTCSCGATDTSCYTIIGTKDSLIADPAYEYAGPVKYQLMINGKTSSKTFPKRDQFSANTKRVVDWSPAESKARPTLCQEVKRPAHEKPETVKTKSPSGEAA